MVKPCMVGLIAVITSYASSGLAADFHIQSEVYVQGETEPFGKNLTVFYAGKVYDFMETPQERITIFDPSPGRFVLLDPKNKISTEITSAELDEFADTLKAKAAKSKERLLQFLSSPEFEVEYQDASGTLTLSSHYISYNVQTVKVDDEEALVLYRAFSDGYAKLNARTNSGSLPPFGRMYLNRILNEYQRLPKTVQLTISNRNPLDKRVLRSEHKNAFRLLDADRQRVEDADELLATLPRTPLDKFLELTLAAETAKKQKSPAR